MDSGGAKSFIYTELHKLRTEQRHKSEARIWSIHNNRIDSLLEQRG